jgi:hypothetical protein
VHHLWVDLALIVLFLFFFTHLRPSTWAGIRLPSDVHYGDDGVHDFYLSAALD